MLKRFLGSVAAVPSSRTSRSPFETVVILIVFVHFAWLAATPFRSGLGLIRFGVDDAYYYLKIAKNLAAGHGSTFNGLVPTNGYHPLWLLVLTAVSLINSSLPVAVGFICVSSFISAILTFLLCDRLLELSGVESFIRTGIALFISGFSLLLYIGGMEVTLTIPLMLGLILFLRKMPDVIGSWHAFGLGVTASAVVLSRLDTAIWIMGLSLMVLTDPLIRTKILKVWPALLAGLTPIAAYLVIERIAFQTWTPVSGQAKQLKPVGFKFDNFLRFNQSLERLEVECFALAAIVMTVWVVANWKKQNRFNRLVLLPTVLFPVIYFTIVAALSDWMLGGWYLYSIPVAGLAASIWFLGTFKLTSPATNLYGRIFVSACAAVCLFQHWGQGPADPGISQAALEIEGFQQSHPGVYAMGDRAGKVGYLLSSPVIQLEGLVMDSSYLSKIRRRENLRSVLLDYGVRYYVATTGKDAQGLFHACEPVQGGVDSPKMEADFPERPVANFKVYGSEVRIFDLKSLRTKLP